MNCFTISHSDVREARTHTHTRRENPISVTMISFYIHCQSLCYYEVHEGKGKERQHTYTRSEHDSTARQPTARRMHLHSYSIYIRAVHTLLQLILTHICRGFASDKYLYWNLTKCNVREKDIVLLSLLFDFSRCNFILYLNKVVKHNFLCFFFCFLGFDLTSGIFFCCS